MKRSTLVAFAVLVALVGVVYWLDQDDGKSPDVEPIFDVAEADIERVEIRRPANETVVIERDGERFRIVEPIDAATDATEVDLVLSNLATMTALRTFAREDDSDPSEYGLDAPTLAVRCVDASGKEHAIRFGKDTLTGSNQYAERDGSGDVMVVGDHLARNLGKSVWDLRDKAIFHLPDDAVPERVTITRGDDVVELVDEDGTWFTGKPPRSRVDRFEVTGMVARFRRADMLDLPEDAVIETSSIRLDVSFRGEVDPMALEIGSKRNVDYLARVPAQARIFLIEGGLVDELQRDARDWWSKKLLHHATTETTVTDIATGGTERSMNRDDAQTLLRALSDATAREIVTELPSGDPHYVIEVTTGQARDEIAIYVTEGKIYATRRDEDVALILPDEAWAAIESAMFEAN